MNLSQRRPGAAGTHVGWLGQEKLSPQPEQKEGNFVKPQLYTLTFRSVTFPAPSLPQWWSRPDHTVCHSSKGTLLVSIKKTQELWGQERIRTCSWPPSGAGKPGLGTPPPLPPTVPQSKEEQGTHHPPISSKDPRGTCYSQD